MIAPLTSGQDFKEDAKNKINEIIDHWNALERLIVTPSDAGRLKIAGEGIILDLSGFLTKEEARNAGIGV